MPLEKYESKQVRINRPDWLIYNLLSDFNNFTPMLSGRVDHWRVEGDTCSFSVKGITLSIRMIEKTPFTTIKLAGEESSPFEFVFWIQLVGVDENDTRLRLTLHANLNVMMKMMVGNKLAQALDQIADQIAAAFNMTPEEARRMAAEQGWDPSRIPSSEAPSPPPQSIENDFDWPMPDPDKPVS